MAIVIPSKNIYGVENQKVRNNVINKVSYNSYRVVSKNEYNVLVHSQQLQPEVSTLRDAVIKKDGKATTVTDVGIFYEVAYISYKPYYANNIKITVPKKKKNAYVEKIYKGQNSEGNFYTKCSLSGDLYKGTAKSSASYNMDGATVTIGDIIETRYGDAIPHTLTIDAAKSDIKYNVPEESPRFNLDITSNVNYEYPTDLSATTYYFENEDEFGFSIYFISSYELIKMYGTSDFNQGQNYFQIGTHSNEHEMDSYAEKFVVKRIEVTVNGDIIGIDIEDANHEHGYGNKPFTVSRSELNQESNLIWDNGNVSKFKITDVYDTSECYIYAIEPVDGFFVDGAQIKILDYAIPTVIYKKNESTMFQYGTWIGGVGDVIECYEQKPAYAKNSENIISRYQNGKETIEVLCGINDYYSEYGKKLISAQGDIEKMTFDIGDIVIPYKYSATMVDEPISLDKDGNKKRFEVVSVKMIYDGATMQKITAQETK